MNIFFFRIYNWVDKNKRISAVFLFLLLVVLGFISTKLRFEEDITKLIPTNVQTEEFQEVLNSVNFTDKIIVDIHRSPEASVDELTQYAQQFLDSLNTNSGEYVKEVQGAVNEEEVGNTLDFVYNNLPLFLEKEDYALIQQKLEEDSIAQVVRGNYRTLISPSGLVAKEMIRKDPFGFSFVALNKLKKIGGGSNFHMKDGFLLDQEERHVMLFITPIYSPNDTDKNEAFVSQLYKIQDNLNTAFKSQVESSYFGSTLIAVANAQQIKKDIQFTVGIALSILLLILILYYRKLFVPIILFFPTLFGALLATTFLFFVREEISAISLGIGSVLLGITLDYSLHILTHIKSNPDKKDLYKQLAKPVIMSSLTTACAFLCLLFLESQALQDLGIFASVSVLGASIFALVFIPQVYKYSASDNAVNKNILDKLVSYPFHRKKWALGLLLLLLISSFFTYNSVGFNNDISQLNYEPEHIKEARNKIDSLTNIASKSIYLATYDSSEERTLQRNDELFGHLQDLKTEGKILQVTSLSALVKSRSNQREKIMEWEQFWNDNRVAYTESMLIERGEEYGFKPDTYSQFFNLIKGDFKALSPEAFEELGFFTLEDYLSKSENLTTTTTLVKLDEANADEVRSHIKTFSNTLLIDRQEMNETFLGQLKDNFSELILYSLIVVFLLLLVFYRSLSLVFVTGLPIFLTWFVTIGLMGLFEIQFNIFNIIISTFIFGLGVDYSIFVTNAMLHELRSGKNYLPTHKVSILLSVLTTILGVGVMIFAKHPALYSISVVSVIGIFSAVFVAFTIQPLLFNTFIGSSKKPPISLRVFFHSLLSFTYFGLGSLVLSLLGSLMLKFFPVKRNTRMRWFHKATSKFFTSVLYSNFFVKKQVFKNKKAFREPSIVIANHSSFLDILILFMTYPKLVFLVNDWVYNSPVFGKGVRAAGFYPVSEGIDNSYAPLKEKISQGYSLAIFPEGTRTETNKIKRFHKGAFVLAQELNLPITPVLIHGNSEVLPKGSFVIRDGSISVKVLEQIDSNSPYYSSNSRQLTKKVSAFFKEEFLKFRRQIEGPKYFHQFVLNEYRFKGNKLFNKVKQDLKENSELYHAVLLNTPQATNVLHLSKKQGQLDFLLTLDSNDRRIFSFIPDQETCRIVNQSYLTQTRGKIIAFDSLAALKEQVWESIIIDSRFFSISEISDFLSDTINFVLIYGKLNSTDIKELEKLNFGISIQEDNLVVLGKKKEYK